MIKISDITTKRICQTSYEKLAKLKKKCKKETQKQ